MATKNPTKTHTTLSTIQTKTIALCELLFAVIIWAKLFEKLSKKRISETALSLFACALLASPFVAAQSAFVFGSTISFLSFASAGICAYCLLKIFESERKLWSIAPYVLLFVFAGVLPNDYGYGVLVVGCTAALLLGVHYNYKALGLWDFIKHALVLVGLMGMVVIADKLIGKVLARILHVDSGSDYQSDYFQWDFSQGIFLGLINGLKSCLDLTQDTVGKIEIYLIVACLILYIIISFNRKSIMPLVGFVFFALSAFALNILTANFSLPARARLAEAFFMAVLLMLLYEILSAVKLRFLLL
jgi:hypothetical protein